MENIIAKEKRYLLFGKIRGAQSNKWNRATKLAYNFDKFDKKFRGIIERGINTQTEHSRCALALLLMMYTGIRVGNEGSAEGYMTKPHPNEKGKVPKFVKTYGLTTLLGEHVTTNRGTIDISFTGKKGVENSFVLKDKFICTSVAILYSICAALEGGVSGNTLFDITDYMLTKFIKKYVGKGYSPKDFRCMKANMYAWEYAKTYFVDDAENIKTKKEFKVRTKGLFIFVSEKLNNTPGVCKKNYVCDKLVPYLESITVSKNI